MKLSLDKDRREILQTRAEWNEKKGKKSYKILFHISLTRPTAASSSRHEWKKSELKIETFNSLQSSECCGIVLCAVRDLLLSVLHCSEISRNWLGRYVNCSTEWIPISYLSLRALIWSSCKPKRRRCRAHSNFNNFFFSHLQSRLDFSHEAKRARAHQMKKSFIFSTRAALFFCSSDFESARRFSREQRSRWKLCSNDQSTYRPRPTDSQKRSWSKQKWSRKKKDRVRASNRFSFVMLSISSLVRLFFFWIPHKTRPLYAGAAARCVYICTCYISFQLWGFFSDCSVLLQLPSIYRWHGLAEAALSSEEGAELQSPKSQEEKWKKM